MASSRFFNYSPTVSDEYKQQLETTLRTMDTSNNVVTHTPYASAFLISLIGAIDLSLDLPSTVSMIPLLISACTVLIMSVSKSVENRSFVNASGLISEGVKEGFFKNAKPLVPVDEMGALSPASKEKAEAYLMHQIDTTKLRLLYSHQG